MGSNITSWKRYLSPPFLARKLREEGLLWCLRTGVVRLSRLIFVILPFALIKSIVRLLFGYPLYFMGVRFVNMSPWLIGHLATDPDCFVKEGVLGMRPAFFEIWLVYPKMKGKSTQVANQHLLNYWRKHIRIITSPFLCTILRPFRRDRKLEYRGINEYTATSTAKYTVIQKAWGDRPPVLSLSESDYERGWDNLRRLGVPEGAWFVTVHCRESGYYKISRPDYAARYAHQDADISTYIPTIKAIGEQGGYCIRVGDPTMKPLPEMDNVIDYVHLDIKSDWMDIFLLASCKFILGSGSGLCQASSVFGIPAALANLAPMGKVLAYGPRDISIPKLLWSCKEGCLLTFKESLDYPIGMLHVMQDYAEAGVRLVDSSPEDIRGLALEMLDRTEGKALYTAQDERLQERFISLLRPGHYSYGASSRVGRDFLRKYAILLPDEEL